MPYLMQARSSSSGEMVTWVSAAADWTGASWPGPGSPLEIAATRGAGVEVGAALVLDIDFAALPSQSLATDGPHTIDGRTWTKRNSSGDAAPMAIVNGQGLVIQPASATDFYLAVNTAPQLDIVLSSINAALLLGRGVTITVYFTDNAAAVADIFCFGVNAQSNAPACMVQRGHGLIGGAGQWVATRFLAGSDFVQAKAVTIGAANEVLALKLPALGCGHAFVTAGAWSSGWPAASSLAAMRGVVNDNIDLTAMTGANASLFFAALRNGSGTAYAVTVKRVKVEVFD